MAAKEEKKQEYSQEQLETNYKQQLINYILMMLLKDQLVVELHYTLQQVNM